MNGTVESIHVAPEAADLMEPRESVDAVAGKGLRGDRYFDAEGTFSGAADGGNELTLVEREAIAAIEREAGIELDPGEHRRNLTTRGVALNHLVGERFRVGDVVCRGVRLCEPCDHLESLTADGVVAALTHRGGLRADVEAGGVIRVGGAVERIE
ncbi:MAG: MOSC domain-containing protein [Haloarculaceae archaeon]